jgi:hypothetical protein
MNHFKHPGFLGVYLFLLYTLYVIYIYILPVKNNII